MFVIVKMASLNIDFSNVIFEPQTKCDNILVMVLAAKTQCKPNLIWKLHTGQTKESTLKPFSILIEAQICQYCWIFYMYLACIQHGIETVEFAIGKAKAKFILLCKINILLIHWANKMADIATDIW